MGVHEMGIAEQKTLFISTLLMKNNVKKSLLRCLRRGIQKKLVLQPSTIAQQLFNFVNIPVEHQILGTKC